LEYCRGWVIPAFIFAPQAMATAMLSSSMPVNGAFYWYTAALAPEKLSRPLAFMVGWTTVLSGVTSIASFAYAVASPLALFVSKLHPAWEPTNPQIMGMSFAIVALWSVLSCLRLERISWMVFGNSKIVMLLTIGYL
jgi:amino acid transporter